MSYTAEQRRLFHELVDNEKARERHGVSLEEAHKLADEADAYAREGKEKPAKKAAPRFIDLTSIWQSR